MSESLQEKLKMGKVIIFLLIIVVFLILAMMSLMPRERNISTDYPAVILDFSTQELLGTTQISFSGTYTQYYSNLIFKDRFAGEFYLAGNKISEQYGTHTLIDFQRGFSIKEGICAYMNTEKNQLESLGNIVQEAPLQTGYLLINKEKSGLEKDIIVVFPAENSDEACEIYNRISK